MKAARESDLLAACLDYLRLKGILAWRANNGGVWDLARKRFRSFHGLKGVADVLGCLPGGRLLAVECKSATGRLSPEQHWFLDAVRASGGLAAVVRDIKELATLLDSLEKQ